VLSGKGALDEVNMNGRAPLGSSASRRGGCEPCDM
jgi:hypothetical protein